MHLSESISDAGNTYWGTSTSTGWQATSDWGRYETSRRRDDVLPMKSTGEGTSYVAADDRLDDESDVDPPREPGPDGAKVALFSKPKPVPTEAEGGSDDEKEDPRFRAYSPPVHMHNVDVSEDDVLEFPDLPHRRRDRASSSLDSGELEVGKEFSNKDSFLGALKQHSIMNGVNYNVVKSKYDKFEAKCAVKDGTCAWKIMASLRKRTGLWEIKKYKGPHTCVGGDLVVGVGRMTHLDKIMNPEVFASSMANVVESYKVMGFGKKKSSLTVTRVIPHATAAYRSVVEQE
ncbi:hypothetical protein J1N35_041121 [Gossypium stocksii]|uniref:Transposase MuDR plant domain-containing protein n=1 Tax=Gossypium stocksii TaxID=47602 RepID=A0A9D3UFE2_9ROSI|nr:hypothetical protein J1N35_041121 [Gossypium stocksii]